MNNFLKILAIILIITVAILLLPFLIKLAFIVSFLFLILIGLAILITFGVIVVKLILLPYFAVKKRGGEKEGKGITLSQVKEPQDEESE